MTRDEELSKVTQMDHVSWAARGLAAALLCNSAEVKIPVDRAKRQELFELILELMSVPALTARIVVFQNKVLMLAQPEQGTEQPGVRLAVATSGSAIS